MTVVYPQNIGYVVFTCTIYRYKRQVCPLLDFNTRFVNHFSPYDFDDKEIYLTKEEALASYKSEVDSCLNEIVMLVKLFRLEEKGLKNWGKPTEVVDSWAATNLIELCVDSKHNQLTKYNTKLFNAQDAYVEEKARKLADKLGHPVFVSERKVLRTQADADFFKVKAQEILDNGV